MGVKRLISEETWRLEQRLIALERKVAALEVARAKPGNVVAPKEIRTFATGIAIIREEQGFIDYYTTTGGFKADWWDSLKTDIVWFPSREDAETVIDLLNLEGTRSVRLYRDTLGEVKGEDVR